VACLPIAEARSIAAAYLADRGLDSQAGIVRAGGGDDFPEVEVALLAIRSMLQRLDRYGRALNVYADADFWDGEFPDAALAFHDHGMVARAVLAGRELFEIHRD
jgi:hypothetical protein